MKDWFDVGSSPPDESCAQVGSDNYTARARRECQAYIRLLRRVHGEEPDGARLAIKSNPHDFGTYLSVVCYYDPERPQSIEYALRCESGEPLNWDEQARTELQSQKGRGP